MSGLYCDAYHEGMEMEPEIIGMLLDRGLTIYQGDKKSSLGHQGAGAKDWIPDVTDRCLVHREHVRDLA